MNLYTFRYRRLIYCNCRHCQADQFLVIRPVSHRIPLCGLQVMPNAEICTFAQRQNEMAGMSKKIKNFRQYSGVLALRAGCKKHGWFFFSVEKTHQTKFVWIKSTISRETIDTFSTDMPSNGICHAANANLRSITINTGNPGPTHKHSNSNEIYSHTMHLTIVSPYSYAPNRIHSEPEKWRKFRIAPNHSHSKPRTI